MRNIKFSIDSNFFQLQRIYKETKSDTGAAWLKRQKSVYMQLRERSGNPNKCYFKINIEPVDPLTKAVAPTLPVPVPVQRTRLEITKAAPLIVHLDGIAFTFIVKRNTFVSADKVHSITLPIAKELYKEQLLRIPRQDEQAAKYLLAS